MPFYMFQGRYGAAAMKAMVDHPQDRAAAVRPIVEAAGGTLHHLFFCFGAEDVVAIAEAPDDVAMASITMAIGASGAMSGGATTKLLTMDEAMRAMKGAQQVAYRPATA
jgi:uncharacterized protein with GYD domain